MQAYCGSHVYAAGVYDHYNDYSFESSGVLDEFVLNYVLALSYEEKTAFLTRLDNLQHTGDRYYYAIDDALEQIQKINQTFG